MLGELWKVAREECRPATTDERTGVEAVVSERQDRRIPSRVTPHWLQGHRPRRLEEGDDRAQERSRNEGEEGRRGDPEDTLDYAPEYLNEPSGGGPEAEGSPKRRSSIADPRSPKTILGTAQVKEVPFRII